MQALKGSIEALKGFISFQGRYKDLKGFQRILKV